MTWEAFRDAAYFNMWCVRPVGERQFGRGFHLVNGDEAKDLADLLAENERLREALEPFTRLLPLDDTLHGLDPDELRAAVTQARAVLNGEAAQ